MTKQEILDIYIPCQCWPVKDGGKKVYNSSCPQHSPDPESAMDAYAKQISIDFVKWKWDNVASCPQHSPDPESAMDAYAKQISIDFVKWKWDNVDRYNRYGEDKRFVLYTGESLTAEELFTKFLKQYNH